MKNSATLETVLQSLIGAYESSKNKNKVDFKYWTSNDGILGVQPRTQILRIVLNTYGLSMINSRKRSRQEYIDSRAAKSILTTYFKENPIKTQRGPVLNPVYAKYKPDNRRSWTSYTLLNWLKCNRKSSPSDDDASRILSAIGSFAKEKLGKNYDDIEECIDIIINGQHKPIYLLSIIVAKLPIPGSLQFEHVRSSIDDSLVTTPALDGSPELDEDAQRIVKALTELGHPRCTVCGPAYSGKTTVISLVLRKVGDRLRLPGGTKLPVLAVSLRDRSSTEAAQKIVEFYLGGQSGPAATHGSADDRLADVRRLARFIPAFVVLTHVEDNETHEISRALRQDFVSDLLDAIVQGNSLTRVLITLTEGRSQPIDSPFRTWHRFNLSPVDGRKRTLTRMAASLVPPLVLTDTENDTRNGVTTSELENALINRLKGAGTLALAGLIATSADGIKSRTLERLIQVAQSHELSCYATRSLSSYLDQLQPLLRVSQIEWSGQGDKLYTVDRSIRDAVLTAWMATGRPAREGAWLIAREAAAQARDMRVTAANGSQASIGRDLQVLAALVASVNPANIERTSDARCAELATEYNVLPPLDQRRNQPPDDVVCAYAFDVLYKADLEGDESRQRPRLEDARLRLAAIRPFFDPHAWRPDSEWTSVAGRERAAWMLLPAGDRAELLQALALAATRVIQIKRLGDVGRAAESLARERGKHVDPRHLMRILRAEVDAALIVGDNLDRVDDASHRPDEKPGVQCILDRIDTISVLLTHCCRPGPMRDVAIGKLLARRAEILHLMGKHFEALATFRSVVDREHASFDGVKLRIAPILGGRGVRSYVRLCLDMQRARLFQPGMRKKDDYSTGDWLLYNDHLALPYPRAASRINEKTIFLRKARSLTAANARRLSNERSADAIGAKMDEAQILVLEHRFAKGLRLLDEAEKLAFQPGSSRDSLLELLALRARALTDVAGFAMATFDLSPALFGADEASELDACAQYAGIVLPQQGTVRKFPGRADGRELSEWFMARARDAIKELQTVVESEWVPGSNDRKPFAIQAAYIKIWLDVIRSRRIKENNVKNKEWVSLIYNELLVAKVDLESVIQRMQDYDVMWQRREAGYLLEGLENFLSKQYCESQF